MVEQVDVDARLHSAADSTLGIVGGFADGTSRPANASIFASITQRVTLSLTSDIVLLWKDISLHRSTNSEAP